jgi:hypothetical protein
MRPFQETSHKGLIAWFSANSVAANLLMLFILAAGIASVFFIKIQVFPDFETRMIQITRGGRARDCRPYRRGSSGPERHQPYSLNRTRRIRLGDAGNLSKLRRHRTAQ